MKGFFSIAGLRRLRVMTWKELLQLLRDTALIGIELEKQKEAA